MLSIINLNVRNDDGDYIVSVANLSDINDFLNYSIYINYDDDNYDVELDNTSALTGLPSYSVEAMINIKPPVDCSPVPGKFNLKVLVGKFNLKVIVDCSPVAGKLNLKLLI